MTEKRRDNKGRVLHSGEYQRDDGKYEYKYIDKEGVRRSAYSWKLVETDKMPNAKRSSISLREIEKNIRRDIEDGISYYAGRHFSLNDLFADYIATKHELKQSTRTNYKYMYNKFVHDEIGMQNVVCIKYSDIRKFYIHLITECGFKPNSMENINTILHPVFTIAVRDGLIRQNPTEGVMAEIKRGYNWEKPKRHALTVTQQDDFISFIAENAQYKHWLPLFTVLLGTGCRVGEISGLRWADCDFHDESISINHTLVYRQQDDGKCEYHITTPKTKAGIRNIPMLSEVKSALIEERCRQMRTGFNETEIDGYSGFVFQNRAGACMNAHCINRAIERITLAFNMQEASLAKRENREPRVLPHFSVHNLRHTFCTRFCENEMNIKVIQEIMGHASISTTMDVYNEATKEKKIESFKNLEGKIRIS